MAAPPDVKILLCARQPDTARRLAAMLAEPGTTIWSAPDEIPPGTAPEVVVVDGTCPEGSGLGPWAAEESASVPGVVRIAGQGPADVQLPEDATARELQLACRLLAEIVRLRRRAQRAAERSRRLVRAAMSDPLTGLPNRRAWDEALAERLAALSGCTPSGRTPGATSTLAVGIPDLGAPGAMPTLAVGMSDRGEPGATPTPAVGVSGHGPSNNASDATPPARRCLCLAILDLDHFKLVNDQFGHTVGDEVLRAAGRAICDGLRADDFVARLGGDEFGLLLWVPDEPTAAAVVDRVRAGLPSRLVEAACQAVASSAGCCIARGAEAAATPSSPEALFAAADEALRQAKCQGRDQTRSGALRLSVGP